MSVEYHKCINKTKLEKLKTDISIVWLRKCKFSVFSLVQ